MYSQKTLLMAALGSQLALALDAQPANPVEALAPRQTNILGEIMDLADQLGLTGCIPYALPLVSDLPTVPEGMLSGDLIQQGLKQVSLDDVCDFTITGDVGKTFTSWLPTLYDYFYEHDADISSIVSECTSASSLSQQLSDFETCGVVTPGPSTKTDGGDDTTTTTDDGDSSAPVTPVPTESGSSWSPVPTTSGGGSDDGGDTTAPTDSSAAPSSTPPPDGAAHRHDGGVAATAAVFAGFMGVVAAL